MDDDVRMKFLPNRIVDVTKVVRSTHDGLKRFVAFVGFHVDREPDRFEVVFVVTVRFRVDFDTSETVDIPLPCPDSKRHRVARGVAREQGLRSGSGRSSVCASMASSLPSMRRRFCIRPSISSCFRASSAPRSAPT